MIFCAKYLLVGVSIFRPLLVLYYVICLYKYKKKDLRGNQTIENTFMHAWAITEGYEVGITLPGGTQTHFFLFEWKIMSPLYLPTAWQK